MWVGKTADGFRLHYRISTDDGATFGENVSVALPNGTTVCANASLAVDANDGVYLAYGCERVSSMGTRSQQKVLVAYSPSGTNAFGDGVEITDQSEAVGVYDQPRIGVSATGVLVTYGQVATTLRTSNEIAAFSNDGTTWIRTPINADVSSSTWRNMGRVLASPSALRVYVAMFDYATSLGLVVHWSDDGGITWPAENNITISDPLSDSSSPLDLAGTFYGDDAWVVYGITPDSLGGGPQSPRLNRLRLVHLHNGGTAFDEPASVDDPLAGDFFMLPNLVYDELNGLNLTYFAGIDAGDPSATYRRSRSIDGGVSFGPSVVVHEPVTFETSRSAATWLGDYQGLWSTASKLYLAYVDNASGSSHIAFYRTPVP